MRQQGASGRLCSKRPLEARPTEGRLLRAMSQQGSNGSRERKFPPSSGSCSRFDHPHGEKLSYCLSGISLEAACVPCLVPRAIFFSTAAPSIAAERGKIPPSLLLPHTPSSQPLLVRPRLQLQPVWWPHWARFPLSLPALVLGSPKPDSVLRCGLSSVSREENPHPSSCWLHCHYYSPGRNQPSVPRVHPIAESHIAQGCNKGKIPCAPRIWSISVSKSISLTRRCWPTMRSKDLKHLSEQINIFD